MVGLGSKFTTARFSPGKFIMNEPFFSPSHLLVALLMDIKMKMLIALVMVIK